MPDVTMEDIVFLCKNRGFVYQNSEIYGGLANTWDYGPLGSELKRNIKNAWIKKFVWEDSRNVLIDSAVLMNPNVWVSSGHVGGFSDPLIDCKNCKTRHRADKLVLESTGKNLEGSSDSEIYNFIKENQIKCPNCGSCDFTPIRKFNLMFKTFMGVTEDSTSEIYLRPETAQGIFVNFQNVLRSSRKKIPFGIAQIGKSFRNEITPGNFIFRTREFEQMELEFFCEPGKDLDCHKYWVDFSKNWLLSLGIKNENIRLREHSKKELSHYSNATTDIEFKFPFGFGELWGVADRTNFDLTVHQKGSGKSLEYFDAETNKKYLPYVIEPSMGVDRAFLAFLCNAYTKEILEGGEDSRIVLKLHPALSPVKVCVMPLSKKLSENALKIKDELSKKVVTDFDNTGSIGKRYRRQDEIGTPFCVTWDFESETDNCVTIRHRDTMKQERVKISELENIILKAIEF